MGIKFKSKKILLIALLAFFSTNISYCYFLNYDSIKTVGTSIYNFLVKPDTVIVYSVIALVLLFNQRTQEKEYKQKVTELEEENKNLKEEIKRRNEHHNKCIRKVRKSILQGKMNPLSTNLYLYDIQAR